MSDIDRLEVRINSIDLRTQKIEQKLFNGMSDALKDLQTKLPQLMTKADHAVYEEAKLQQMREIGQKKDRLVKIFGIVMGFLGSGSIAGIITLLVRNG